MSPGAMENNKLIGVTFEESQLSEETGFGNYHIIAAFNSD